MYMYVCCPSCLGPTKNRVELNLQCAVRIFNTVQMQLWQSSTFSNYPLNIHIKYVAHMAHMYMYVAASGPHASWPNKKCQGLNLI